jgi:SAM-dependent methyltransferase
LTGVDSSAESIAEARESVVPVRWVLGDMCELPWSEEFQGAYCFGNSFSYLDHEGASRFLKAVAGALRPGGRFVMETGMAAEAILPVLGKGLWHRFGDILVLSENRYHPAESRLDIDYTFIQNGQVETRPSSSYCFTAGEICRLHAAAGLQVLELRDGCTEKPFQLGSRSLVVISQR